MWFGWHGICDRDAEARAVTAEFVVGIAGTGVVTAELVVRVAGAVAIIAGF
jgi:hypothetical protein